MKKELLKLFCAMVLLSWAGCARESCVEDACGGLAEIALSVESAFPSKSSAIADESLVRDLNVWVFDSSGGLAESYYYDELSIRTSGSVSFESSVGGHSKLVVIGNAGRRLQPPSRSSERVSFERIYPIDGSGVMLMVGEGSLALTSSGLQSNVTLRRAMSRIVLRVELSSSLASAGGSLGGNVRIREARFCNSPDAFSIVPSSAWDSVSHSKAGQGVGFQTGDRLSSADLASLQSGRSVYLYSLPNYTDATYSDGPSDATKNSTYIEMTVDFDAFSNVSAGSVVCRFYANDGARIGLEGGCSYTCNVILSNDGASNTWRKDDFRFENPSVFIAGEEKTVTLHSQTHSSSDMTFSLSEEPGVIQNAIFRIGDKVVSEYLRGVKVSALTAGSGTLYCFDSEGNMMGSAPLSSAFPSIAVSDKTLDVVGDEVNLDIQGLSEAYSVRGSDELFNNLYSVASIEALEPSGGLFGQDFIYGELSGKRIYVNKLQWTRNGLLRNWTEAVGVCFPYRVTLECGISADFNVTVTNNTLASLESDKYFGEAFDMTLIDDPLPAVAALNNIRSIIADFRGDIPRGFLCTRAEREADGWRTWYGGTRFEGGHIADSYINAYSTTQLRWDLPTEAVRQEYGADVPIFVGKLNRHCNQYVKVCPGRYASTCYVPIGIDCYTEVLDFGRKTTCLCFRPHNNGVALDLEEGSFDYQGRDGGNLYSNDSGIGIYGYAYVSDGSYLETNWDGEIMPDYFNSTADFVYTAVSPYNTPSFGARSGKHLALYHYAPYTYYGGHAEIADENGHVSGKGYVSVEKWSVSSKAFFDWDSSEFKRPSFEDP